MKHLLLAAVLLLSAVPAHAEISASDRQRIAAAAALIAQHDLVIKTAEEAAAPELGNNRQAACGFYRYAAQLAEEAYKSWSTEYTASLPYRSIFKIKEYCK